MKCKNPSITKCICAHVGVCVCGYRKQSVTMYLIITRVSDERMRVEIRDTLTSQGVGIILSLSSPNLCLLTPTAAFSVWLVGKLQS